MANSNSKTLISRISERETIANDCTLPLAKRTKAIRQANHFAKSLDAIIADYPQNVIAISKQMSKHITRNKPSKVKRANWKCINTNCNMFDQLQKDRTVFKYRNGNSITSLCINKFCRSKLVKMAYDFENETRVSTLPKYHCAKCQSFVKQFSARIAITEKIERGEIPFCPKCGNGITLAKGFRKVKE